MISIQVSGDFQESAFRSTSPAAALLVNEFIEYIRSKGYRQIVRHGRNLIEAFTNDGKGYCRIESGSIKPNGVR
jgi:hypothetical protein